MDRKRDTNADPIESLIVEASGDSITRETLVGSPERSGIIDYLEESEQPHFVLRGRLLDHETAGEKQTREASRMRKVASRGRDLLSVYTDRRLLIVVGRETEDETRSILYETLTDVDYESARGGKRLVVRGEMYTYYIDVSRSDESEITAATQFLRARIAEESDASDADSATDDPLTRLERLADLREKGAITDSEFEQKKRDLLDRI